MSYFPTFETTDEAAILAAIVSTICTAVIASIAVTNKSAYK